jgi:hypothetical protein
LCAASVLSAASGIVARASAATQATKQERRSAAATGHAPQRALQEARTRPGGGAPAQQKIAPCRLAAAEAAARVRGAQQRRVWLA